VEAEELRRRVRETLAGLSEGGGARETLQQVLDLVSEASGCDFVTRGFGRDFVVREGPLCERSAAGLILRHPNGAAQLACMCGAVVQGRTNPGLPIFTPGGSFWTNGTTELLREAPPGESVGIRPRNYCNEVGYESVALIPLRASEGILGLLQLNSRTPGRFTAEKMEEYEAVAREIATVAAGKVDEGEGRRLPG